MIDPQDRCEQGRDGLCDTGGMACVTREHLYYYYSAAGLSNAAYCYTQHSH